MAATKERRKTDHQSHGRGAGGGGRGVEMKAGVAAGNQNTLHGGECVRRSSGVRTEGRGKGGVPKSPFFEGAMGGGGAGAF